METTQQARQTCRRYGISTYSDDTNEILVDRLGMQVEAMVQAIADISQCSIADAVDATTGYIMEMEATNGQGR